MSLSKFAALTATALGGIIGVVGILYAINPAYVGGEFHIPSKEVSPPVVKAYTLDWSEALAEAPWEPRDSGEAFVFQDKIWIMGGLNGNASVRQDSVVEYWLAPHFNDLWNSVDGVHWTKVASSNAWTPRRSLSVVFFNGMLWMMGGWSPETGYTNDIWNSTDGVNWTKVVTNAPWPAREGQLVEVFQNKLWLMGGVNYDERQTKNDVWYSENGITWTRVETIPWVSRWDHATAVFDGKMYLVGGMNLNQEVFDDVWVTEDGITWTLITDNPPWEARQGHALESYQGKLWLIGRLNDAESGGVNDVWYSNDGIAWYKTLHNPRWAGREDFFSAVFNDTLLVFGGMDASWTWRNDVWISDITIE